MSESAGTPAAPHRTRRSRTATARTRSARSCDRASERAATGRSLSRAWAARLCGIRSRAERNTDGGSPRIFPANPATGRNPSLTSAQSAITSRNFGFTLQYQLKDAAISAFARLASRSPKLIAYKVIRHLAPATGGTSIRVRSSALVAANAGLRKIHLDHHRRAVRRRLPPGPDFGSARQSTGDEHHRRRLSQWRGHPRHCLVPGNAESRAGRDSAQHSTHLPRRESAIDGPGVRPARE